MARRRPAPVRARGGEGISPPRPARARLITGVLAVATLAGVGAYAAAAGGTLPTAGGAIAGTAALVLALAVLLRVPAAVPWAVALAGAGYVVAREHQRLADGWSAVVGAGLLLAAELAAWSIGHDRRIREEREVVLRRVLVVAALVLS